MTMDFRFDSKNSQKLDEDEQDLVDRLSDLYKVYVKYQEFWGAKSVIDFNDIVVESINLLKSKPLIRQKLQKKYTKKNLDLILNIFHLT